MKNLKCEYTNSKNNKSTIKATDAHFQACLKYYLFSIILQSS